MLKQLTLVHYISDHSELDTNEVFDIFKNTDEYKSDKIYIIEYMYNDGFYIYVIE